MGISIEKLEIAAARDRIGGLNYATVQGISEYRIGKVADLKDFDEAECIEARFFSETEEIRFFRKDDDVKAVKVSDGNADYMDEEYVMADNFAFAGKAVTVRKYIDEDEDGQVFIAATRLYKIKEA